MSLLLHCVSKVKQESILLNFDMVCSVHKLVSGGSSICSVHKLVSDEWKANNQTKIAWLEEIRGVKFNMQSTRFCA